jgi:hypothetical protein
MGEMTRLVRHLQAAGRLSPGVNQRRALSLLMVLTSYETFRELRDAGRSERELAKVLQESARRLVTARRGDSRG